jgi:hypothetical protein
MLSTIGINPYLANLIEEGSISRTIREALVSETKFRMDISNEVFQGKMGDSYTEKRPGLLPVVLNPLAPGTDPTPMTYEYESFEVNPALYPGTIDLNLLNNYVAVNKESLDKTRNLSIQAAQSVDRLCRNSMFRSYLGGNTLLTAAPGAGATTIHVASVNGFTTINSATTGKPVAVSATNPLAITFGGGSGEPANTVVAAVADDPVNAPFGPGTLTLGAATAIGPFAREAVLAANRSQVIFAGGGNSVDAITGANTLTMSDILNATGSLKRGPAKVPRFPDGNYHCHLGSQGQTQLLNDPLLMGLQQGERIPPAYRDASIGILGNAILIDNEEVPTPDNTGTGISSGAGASLCSNEIGADIVNNTNVNIGYTIVYGVGHCFESYIPPMSDMAEVEIAKKESMMPVSSSGISLDVDRIEYIIRPPMDRLGKKHSMSWCWIGDFPTPSDITTQARRFRRAVVIAHAIP